MLLISLVSYRVDGGRKVGLKTNNKLRRQLCNVQRARSDRRHHVVDCIEEIEQADFFGREVFERTNHSHAAFRALESNS